MTRLLPPILVAAMAPPLALLWLYHPTNTPMFSPGPPPWDIPLVLGIALLVGARVQFARANAEILTFAEPRNLVTTGLYRFSRNPMYLGFVLVLLGGAVFVNTACALLAPVAFFAAANWWYIPFEERAARARFGADYDAYAATVRRWI